MKVVNVSPHSIKPYPGNPRRNKQAVIAVRHSLDEYKFRQPIVVDADNVIVVGHTRWEASLLPPEYKTIPVHVAGDLTPEQCRAYRLVDNKVGELADWDEDLFQQEVAAILADGTDLTQFGFTEADLKVLEDEAEKVKVDNRWLENYDVLPEPKPHWILIKAPEDLASELVTELRNRQYQGVGIHYSGEAPPAKDEG